MPESTRLPPGLLSFIYNAFYDKDTIKLCQTNIQTALANFEITNSDPVYDILTDISQGGSLTTVVDPSVFDECIEFIRGKYSGSESTRKLNALILVKELCAEGASKVTIIW